MALWTLKERMAVWYEAAWTSNVPNILANIPSLSNKSHTYAQHYMPVVLLIPTVFMES